MTMKTRTIDPSVKWYHHEHYGRVRVAGLDEDGDPVWTFNGGREVSNDTMGGFASETRPLPECDGWDWVEPPVEKYPKWHVRAVPTACITGVLIAYSRQDGPENGETFLVDGTSYKWSSNVRSKGWIEVTEAEAIDTMLPQKPAETWDQQSAVAPFGKAMPPVEGLVQLELWAPLRVLNGGDYPVRICRAGESIQDSATWVKLPVELFVQS